MDQNPTVSVIVPLGRDQRYLKACVEACVGQRSAGLEIIVLPDDPLGWSDDRIHVEVTGPATPAEKRNRGVRIARAPILAFIDDDTRPLPGWLDAVLPHFEDPKVAAVGGPAVTPADDPYWAQVSGAAYASWALSGTETWRYLPARPRDVDDVPSCNLIVRRSAFEEVGGFQGNYWPGEDTYLCLALIRKGYRIRYEPRAVVDHHRRASLKGHLRQISNYALHRGYFAKRFPETSFRLIYFLPTLLLLLTIVAAVLAFVDPGHFAKPVSIGVLAYLVILLASVLRHSPTYWIPTVLYVGFSHFLYGANFLRGLFASRLREESPRPGV